MKNRRAIFVLLTSSAFILNVSAICAADSSVQEGMFDYVYNKTKSTVKGVKGMLSSTPSIVQDVLDEHTKSKIEEISETISEFADTKFHDYLFLDKVRYGRVASTNEFVKIYMNESQAINTLFEKVAGMPIDDFIANLPVGVRQLSKIAKARLEKSILYLISTLAVKPLVKETVKASLLKSYEYLKPYASLKEKIVDALKTCRGYLGSSLNGVVQHAKEKISNLFFASSQGQELLPLFTPSVSSEEMFPFPELSSAELQEYFNPSVHTSESVNTSENMKDPLEASGFKSILNKYLYDIKVVLNSQLYQAIEESLTEVTTKTISTGIDAAVKGVKYISLAGGAIVNPSLFGVSLLADLSRPYIANKINGLASPFIHNIKNRIISSEFLPVNHEHAGAGSFKEAEEGFTSLEIAAPNIITWASTLKDQVKDKISQKAGKALKTAQQTFHHLKDTLQEATQDIDVQGGISSGAHYMQNQFAPHSIATVQWNTPSLNSNSDKSTYAYPYTPSQFESVEKDLQTKESLSNKGIVGKIKGWLSW